MVVTPNNARKCARKDVKTCERTNFCTLVRYEVGEAEGPYMDFDKEMIAASKIYKIKYKVPPGWNIPSIRLKMKMMNQKKIIIIIIVFGICL